MTQPADNEVHAVSSEGVPVKPVAKVGCTLTAGTWFFPVTILQENECIHMKWDAALVAVITFEDSNAPAFVGSPGSVDVSDFDDTPGNWIPQNPDDAYVPFDGDSITVDKMTVTIAGGDEGGASYNISGIASKRGRVRVEVDTGGVIRVMTGGRGR